MHNDQSFNLYNRRHQNQNQHNQDTLTLQKGSSDWNQPTDINM